MRPSMLLLTAFALTLGGKATRAERPGRVRVIAVEQSEMVKVPAGAFTMGAPTVPLDNTHADVVGPASAFSRLVESETEFLFLLCEQGFGRAAHNLCPELERLLGPFVMGGAVSGIAEEREVHLSAFEIDRYETSVGQYRQCVRAGVCDVDALLFGDQRYSRREWPMVNVTYDEARSYCQWRGKRLPTEAEWEKAARGVEAYRFPWGNRWQNDRANHGKLSFGAERSMAGRGTGTTTPLETGDDRDGHAYAAEPGAMLWGDSPYGAADMAGNVREWVADYYDPRGYSDLPAIDPRRDTSAGLGARAVRGGSWLRTPMFQLSYLRDAESASHRAHDLGFRCARSLRD